ncbi:MAG: hypothetical protein SFZ03_08975 [Candidatus Melainabacteria bacterium]|nr:hypothetical protein [Candidatus Melainabacteria bacterium]
MSFTVNPSFSASVMALPKTKPSQAAAAQPFADLRFSAILGDDDDRTQQPGAGRRKLTLGMPKLNMGMPALGNLLAPLQGVMGKKQLTPTEMLWTAVAIAGVSIAGGVPIATLNGAQSDLKAQFQPLVEDPSGKLDFRRNAIQNFERERQAFTRSHSQQEIEADPFYNERATQFTQTQHVHSAMTESLNNLKDILTRQPNHPLVQELGQGLNREQLISTVDAMGKLLQNSALANSREVQQLTQRFMEASDNPREFVQFEIQYLRQFRDRVSAQSGNLNQIQDESVRQLFSTFQGDKIGSYDQVMTLLTRVEKSMQEEQDLGKQKNMAIVALLLGVVLTGMASYNLATGKSSGQSLDYRG